MTVERALQDRRPTRSRKGAARRREGATRLGSELLRGGRALPDAGGAATKRQRRIRALADAKHPPAIEARLALRPGPRKSKLRCTMLA
jgi:hypothetical protein